MLSITLNATDLKEKIGQLVIAPISALDEEEQNAEVLKLLKERRIGNVILMSGTLEAQRKLIQSLENQLDRPIFTFQDAEWGTGMRLRDVPSLPRNLTLGAVQDLGLLKLFGLELAYQCRGAGIQGNFAPVIDVNSNPQNPVIHRRSFGSDPNQVAKRGLAVMEGMQEGGIWACAKHFPGHGDTVIDSHRALPCIDKDLSEIEQNELIPFRALIDKGVDMVMVGHLSFPQLSDEPSSLSDQIITKLLRQELGFQGVVVTDALNMAALCEDPEQVALKALYAGCDLLLYAAAKPEKRKRLIEEVIPRVIDRVAKEVPEALIDEKLERIEKMRAQKRGEMPRAIPHLKRDLFRSAITVVGDLPVIGNKVALVENAPDPDFESFLSRYTEVVIFSYEEMEQAKDFSSVVINVRKGELPKDILPHAVVAVFDTPYTLYQLNHRPVVVGYEDEKEAKEAVTDVLFGHLEPLGKLPIPL